MEVALDGKELFFDPGSKYAAYGQLPWFETAVSGRRLDADGGQWLTTSIPKSHDSRTLRKGTLQVDAHGTVSGNVTVTYTGEEALSRRMQENGEDGTDRKKFLEDQIKYDMPSGVDVELVNAPDWEKCRRRADRRIHGEIARLGCGRRTACAVSGGVVRRPRERRFPASNARASPVFPLQPAEDDDITVELAPGWKVASVPAAQTLEQWPADIR